MEADDEDVGEGGKEDDIKIRKVNQKTGKLRRKTQVI